MLGKEAFMRDNRENKAKGAVIFFKNLLFPPKCVGCRELYQKDILDKCEYPLCEKCRVRWEYEKLSLCPDCGLEMSLCNCGSTLLSKLEIEKCIKLVSYSAQKGSVGKSAVLYMKKKRSAGALGYFAKQLSYPVIREIKKGQYENAVFAYVPRGKVSLVKYGFDQSRELAERLARLCGGRCIRLFDRAVEKSVEQKKLTLSQRMKGAKGVYKLHKNAAEEVANADIVFVVDDVLTSGASLAGCIMALKSVYGGEIACVTLARTAKSRKK